jgi:hypothetical protein
MKNHQGGLGDNREMPEAQTILPNPLLLAFDVAQALADRDEMLATTIADYDPN